MAQWLKTSLDYAYLNKLCMDFFYSCNISHIGKEKKVMMLCVWTPFTHVGVF